MWRVVPFLFLLSIPLLAVHSSSCLPTIAAESRRLIIGAYFRHQASWTKFSSRPPTRTPVQKPSVICPQTSGRRRLGVTTILGSGASVPSLGRCSRTNQSGVEEDERDRACQITEGSLDFRHRIRFRSSVSFRVTCRAVRRPAERRWTATQFPVMKE
jgi:hypothetical protein